MTALATVHKLDIEDLAIDPVVALQGSLNKLRFMAKSCRSQSRLDLFKACQMFSSDDTAAASGFATALLRTFEQALERKPVILAPGVDEQSFDETWLLRVLDRAVEGDDQSLSFLLMSRVRMEKRHAFLYLINGLADRIDAL